MNCLENSAEKTSNEFGVDVPVCDPCGPRRVLSTPGMSVFGSSGSGHPMIIYLTLSHIWSFPLWIRNLEVRGSNICVIISCMQCTKLLKSFEKCSIIPYTFPMSFYLHAFRFRIDTITYKVSECIYHHYNDTYTEKK